MAADFYHDLELLLRSRYGVIFVETAEKDRAESLLKHLADRLGLPFFLWTRTKGLRRGGEGQPVYGSMSAAAALQEIEASSLGVLYLFEGLGHDLEDRTLAGHLRDAAQAVSRRGGSIVVSGRDFDVPEALKPLSAVIGMPLPSTEDYRELLKRLFRDLSAKGHVEILLTPEETAQLLHNLQGLTLMEAEKILTKAIVEDGKLSAKDIEHVMKAKKAIIEREGLLEYYPAEESLDDIAGLSSLKRWLEKRRAILREPERARAFGLPFPKGILLLGVQGCGKSLCAKAVARSWGLPLLKMDPGSLYNKYVGESERNFRRAVEVAEKMAPVVLWLDEIEKAFASAGEMDGGVSARVLGIFLHWLQERRGDVFVVATANDIHKLPPELVRKGRFDEIFFVDLPTPEVREAILRLHLRKRGRAPEGFDLASLVKASEGFSGAEIEQAIVAALYTAFDSGAELSMALLLEEIGATEPLSKTMGEAVAALRAWAKGRTVSAE